MAQLIDCTLWAGTEASFYLVCKAEEEASSLLRADFGRDDEDDEEALPRLLEVNEGVATVSIKGSLVNSDAWYNEFFGLTGYPEIREAVIAAATDPEVQHIILDIDSGGGAVSGVDDTARLIRMVNDRVKPVTAFTDGNMMSAAYWLGSAAGEVFISKAAGAGSIGVIATHMERAEMFKEMGIGVTVVRAGKYKALANGVEKLSEEGREQIQQGVDAAYKVFLEHVGEMRGKSVEYVDTVMGQGRLFYGASALDVGIADGITTFNALLSNVKEKLIATSANSMDNRNQQPGGLRVDLHGDADMAKKKTLTEQEIAALAAGGTLGAEASVETAGEPAVDEQEPAVASVEEDASEQVAKDGTDDAAEEVVQQVAASDASHKFLSEQLKAVQEDLVQARIALAKTEDKLAEMSAVVDPLKDIAVKAVNNMRVALGGSVMDMGALTAAQVVAEYASVAANFTQKFKVGGVAATDSGLEKKGEHKVDALTQARLNAVRTIK